ncbi:magnesium and cobalt transport protein CorA [Streptomyces purpurascens]|uniref:Magnesium and cobalt transport protein CorA n=1 Tax=Streptomyces purpurascens TaxID=1924 RepID=A0ABZ1MXP4_STREF|nr:magnesium and cobalt transport protein CorA [Streptomyces purpurascens]MCE7049600.1 magnesium and cobalt transport protein CorA [Streptomyces purpurascens]GHA44740.1 magnesium transport protein CorA [Streptomyces purpurascens]
MTAHDPPRQEIPVVDCALYEYGRRRPGRLPLDEAMDATRTTPGGFVWIGLHAPTAGQLQIVARAFGLHPLAVEDALNAHQRPKLERYDDTLFLVLRTAVYLEHEELTPTTDIVGTGEIMAFVGRDFIVVVRHDPARHLSGVRTRLEADPGRLAHGPVAVLHAIADTVVDQYLDVVAALEADADQVEFDAFSPDARHDVGRVYQLKRELLELRRTVAPLAQPLADLAERRVPGVDRQIAAYFRDVADHLAQAAERVTVLTELVDNALSMALAQTSVQQNHDVRRISAAAALIAIPVAIAAVYGMNFDHMPELERLLGYPAMLIITAALVTLVYLVFRRKRWL